MIKYRLFFNKDLGSRVRMSEQCVFGLAKNERKTINDDDLNAAKILARELLNYSTTQLDKLVSDGKLHEVRYEKQNFKRSDS